MTEPASLPPTPRSRDPAEHAWLESLARFDAAALTTALFCAAEGVSVASFYHVYDSSGQLEEKSCA